MQSDNKLHSFKFSPVSVFTRATHSNLQQPRLRGEVTWSPSRFVVRATGRRWRLRLKHVTPSTSGLQCARKTSTHLISYEALNILCHIQTRSTVCSEASMASWRRLMMSVILDERSSPLLCRSLVKVF